MDDETQITRVLKTALSSQGYEVKSASDGESALNLALDWIPDLIVTDAGADGCGGGRLRRIVTTAVPEPKNELVQKILISFQDSVNICVS